MSRIRNKNKNLVTSLIVLLVLGLLFIYEEFYYNKGATTENTSNDNLNIMFFYVGQADSTFIKINDKTMLIDAGNNKDGINIANFLKDNGIAKIDYLIGTHSDEDHIGGIDDIIKELNIGKIYMPTVGKDGNDYKNAVKEANSKELTIENPVRGDKFSLGNANCEIMSAMEGESVTDNNSSIVIQMEYGSNKYLFMGDAEKEVENSRSWENVDVLKVGHHGSNSSSSTKFLEMIKPKYAIIEVGQNNSYKLPNEKAIDRLEKAGATVFRTDKANGDEAGSFLITSDGNSIEIKEVDINLDGDK